MINKVEIQKLTKKITDNFFATRPQKDVVYRPCLKNEAVSSKILGEIYVDLKKMYPEAVTGDYAFVTTRIIASRSETVTLRVTGKPEVYLNDEQIYLNEKNELQMHVETGDLLTFKCTAEEDCFGVGFAISTIFYPGMWACDYLLWVRATMPVPEYYGEDGVSISKLNRCDIAFPMGTTDDKNIDFAKIYPNGEYAFALTYALCDTVYNGEGEAFVNGQKYDGAVIKKGSSLIVRANRKDGF